MRNKKRYSIPRRAQSTKRCEKPTERKHERRNCSLSSKRAQTEPGLIGRNTRRRSRNLLERATSPCQLRICANTSIGRHFSMFGNFVGDIRQSSKIPPSANRRANSLTTRKNCFAKSQRKIP